MLTAAAVLGIDLGSSATKVVLVDEYGETRAAAGVEHQGLVRDRVRDEVNVESWWGSATAAVHACLAERGDLGIAAIGLSGQMHGLVLLDSAGSSISPAYTWQDLQAASYIDTFAKLNSDPLWNPVIPGMAGLTMMRLATENPALVEATAFALQPKDWLGYRLTGCPLAERSDASATLLWDFETDTWDAALVEQIWGGASVLPPLIGSFDSRGTLSAEAAAELRLTPSIPVAAGLADTAAALLGNEVRSDGDVALGLGTGAQICVVRDRPVRASDLTTHFYCGPEADQWYRMAAIGSAGATIAWLCQLWDLSVKELFDVGLQVDLASDGLFFHPFIAGERTPHMNLALTADWVGVTRNHSRPEFIRAALEGIVFALLDAWDALNISPLPASVSVTGGGTLDARWLQLIADSLGITLRSASGAVGSARGAAITAARLLGWDLSRWQADESVVVRPSQTPQFVQSRERWQRSVAEVF